MDLVETLVEIVKHFEFVLRIAVETADFFNLELGLGLTVWVRLVERQDLFLFGFKFSAEFSGLEDSASEVLVLPQCLHACKTVGGEGTELGVFLIPLVRHFSL